MPAFSFLNELDQSLTTLSDHHEHPVLASSAYYLFCLHALNQSQNAPTISHINQLLEHPESICFYRDLGIDFHSPPTAEQLLRLCQLLLEHNLHTNPIGFYLHLFPNLVCTPSDILDTFPGEHIKIAWLLHCVLDYYYIIASRIDSNCDTEELIAGSILSNCDPGEYYRSHISTFTQMDSVGSDLHLVWQSCFITHLAKHNTPFSIRALKDFFPVYNTDYIKLIPPAEFLEDYSIVYSGARITQQAWQHWDNIMLDPQLKKRDLPYLNALFALRNEPPNSVIQALLCPISKNGMFSDDYGIEASYVLNTILSISLNARNILIIHPTPFFVTALNKTNLSNTATTFFMPNDVICRLLANDAFPLQHYVSKLDENSKFDIIVYFGNRSDDTLDMFTPFAHENTTILLFCPEVTFLKNTFLSGLKDNRIQLQSVTSIPPGLSDSKPKKKVLALGHMRCNQRSDDIKFYSIKDLGNDTFYIKTHPFPLSMEELFRTKTFLQLIKSKEIPTTEIPAKKPTTTKIYDFSREIKICYTLLPERHNRYCARAFYKSAENYFPRNPSDSRPTKSSDRKPRIDRSLTPITERGLRAKSAAAVIARLELRVFDEDFYPVIMDDIVRNFRECPESLSLKTIWFLTYHALRHTLTYDHQKAIEIFCSNDSQPLSSLIPAQCTEQHFHALIDETDHTSWFLINSILSKAVEMHILPFNSVSNAQPIVESRLYPGKRILRSQFVNPSFTWPQERRIVEYIFRTDPATGYPKYVENSQWLGIAIRLFTGMNTREVGALQWEQFVYDETHNFHILYIIQHLNDANEPISNAEFHNAKSHRKFPCPTLLATILNQRLEYIRSTFSYSNDEIKKHPIVLKSEYPRTRKSSFTPRFSSRKDLRGTVQAALSIANIQQELVSISDRDSTIEIDLNQFSGDRFSAHFRSRAYHICGLSEGELSYICGIKPTAVVDDNYADFSINLVQHRIMYSLDQWVSAYTIPTIGIQSDFLDMVAPAMQYQDTQIIIPPQDHPTSITLSSPYRFRGSITTFSPEDL